MNRALKVNAGVIGVSIYRTVRDGNIAPDRPGATMEELRASLPELIDLDLVDDIVWALVESRVFTHKDGIFMIPRDGG